MCLLLSAARDPQTHNLDMFITLAGHIFNLHKLPLNKVLKKEYNQFIRNKELPVEKPQRNPARQSQDFGTPHSITLEIPGISYSHGFQCWGFFFNFQNSRYFQGMCHPHWVIWSFLTIS